MKNSLTIIVIAILIAACSSNANKTSIEDLVAAGDTKALQSKKSELRKTQQETAKQLKEIEEALSQLNRDSRNPTVTTLPIVTTKFNHFLELQGNVVTKQNIVIYPEFSGVLIEVFVKEGQAVKKGQKLARIDDGGLSQQLAQLEAQAALAKTTYERQKRLWDQKIGSEIQYLQAETTYLAQQNAVDQMKKQLAKTIVTAPFSGIIDDVLTDEGTVVAPGGSMLMRIVNLDNMYIEAEVPEAHIKNVTKGKSVEVYFPILGKTVQTSIRQVGNYINPSNRSFKIEIGIPNKDHQIKPNLTSRLKINDYTNETAVLIPQSIITENASGEQYVYAVIDKNENIGEAKRIIISTGKTQGDFIEVLGGLEPGMEIIEEGARTVNQGQSVKVVE
ncbi:efflux RND transporter periplasmic adaptor subunit [Urechidicola sp. KH5]